MKKKVAILAILAAAILGAKAAQAWDGPIFEAQDYTVFTTLEDASADAQLILPPQDIQPLVAPGVFSDDSDDYGIYIADLGDGKVAFAIYGKFTTEVQNSEVATMTVNLRMMKDLGSGLVPYPEADPWVYTFPMAKCEIIM